MRKKFIFIVLLLFIVLTGCEKKEYEGYWCKYNENATVIVLLEKEHTEAEKSAVEQKIKTYTDIIEDPKYYTREQYAEDIGESIDDIDIYDTFVVSFATTNSIDKYVEEIKNMNGVKEVSKNYTKSDISLYYLGNNKEYTYANSDEANNEDIVKGKYKIKNKIIKFTPINNQHTTPNLYLKDGYVCGDADCNIIYSKTDSECQPITE